MVNGVRVAATPAETCAPGRQARASSAQRLGPGRSSPPPHCPQTSDCGPAPTPGAGLGLCFCSLPARARTASERLPPCPHGCLFDRSAGSATPGGGGRCAGAPHVSPAGSAKPGGGAHPASLPHRPPRASALCLATTSHGVFIFARVVRSG